MAVEVLIINSNRVLLVDTTSGILADFEEGADKIFKPIVTHDLETPSRRERIQKELTEKFNAPWQRLRCQTAIPGEFNWEWFVKVMEE